MKSINKKGIELSNAFGAILAVILVAVLVIIAIFMFEILSTSLGSNSASVVNETPAWINNTPYVVDNAGACDFGGFAVSAAFNDTSGLPIVLANITTNAAGSITNASVIVWPNVSLSYTYTFGGDACNASEAMITQFATYPALVGLVGTIIFLGIVIGVLVASFVFGGKRGV